MNRDPADVVTTQLDLASMQPRPYLDAELASHREWRSGLMARPGQWKVARTPSPVNFISLPGAVELLSDMAS